jgi:hypothetical protein
MNDEIDIDLLIQQMRDEQIWQMQAWQNEILEQWEGPYGRMGPNKRNAEHRHKFSVAAER